MTSINTSLTPRQRFQYIMARQEPDRVPLDLAGTSLTGISPSVAESLGKLLGLSQETGACSLEEALQDALEIDFRRVGGLIASGDRPVPGKPGFQVDMWGVVRAWTGQYWDIVHSPLKNAVLEDLEAYPWPDPQRWIDPTELQTYRAKARHLWERTESVIVGEHPVYGIFELACWMCGFDDFLWRLAGDKAFVHRLFAILLDLQKQFIEPYYRTIGAYIHLTTSGDDFGTQIGPFLSPKAFREMVKPYFAERIAFTRSLTPAHYWHHSCGSIYDLLPDLIDAGVEIINPIQPGACKMEPDRLKADFGGQLCFHGGFDTQGVLPFGSQEAIEAEVQRVMDALKPGGGFIFSAAHNIQEDVPPENVLAMFRAARRLGEYPL